MVWTGARQPGIESSVPPAYQASYLNSLHIQVSPESRATVTAA